MGQPVLARRNDQDILAGPSGAPSSPGQLHALLLTDELTASEQLRSMLHQQMYRVTTCSGVSEAIAILESGFRPSIAFFSASTRIQGGKPALSALREAAPHLPSIPVCSSADPRPLIELMRNGALDGLLEPLDRGELRRLLQRHAPTQAVAEPEPLQEIPVYPNSCFVICSDQMREIARQSAVIARFDLPVLIMGETGTGKEILARYIHQMSHCADRAFLKVNCAAMPADLLESELLGYEQGAFTGAIRSKPGRFELCDKGTIFLDEIGEMPAGLQAKLLQVLQDGTFSRLGGRATLKVNVRVIAATNVNIKTAIAQQRLREDLYHRLNGFSITLPPLRERKLEIPVLLHYFINRLAEKYARRPVAVSKELLDACVRHPWTGNVRELENFVKRLLVLGDEQIMMQELSPPAKGSQVLPAHSGLKPHSEGLKSLMKCLREDAEAEIITNALQRNDWRHKRTAAELKISYKALLYKIRDYRITDPRRPTPMREPRTCRRSRLEEQ